MSDIRERVFQLIGFTAHEKVTGAVATIDTNHGQVHDKNAFSLPGLSEALAAGGTFILTIEVPATTYVHFQAAKIHATGHAKIEIYEGQAGNEDGAAATPLNRHRLGGGASTLTCRTNDTGLAGGALLAVDVVGSSGPGAAVIGGNTGDDAEWILDQGETYTIIVTNKESSAAIDVSVQPFWYEEPAA